MQDTRKDDTEDLLPRLWEEIERAWNTRRDHEVVHRLAAKYPDLAEDLYEFFADVVEAGDDLGRLRPEYADRDRKVREYLQREGYERAVAAALADSSPASTPTPAAGSGGATLTPPKAAPLLAMLRRETGESVHSLARDLGITAAFLVVVSENGSRLPAKARNELVRRVRKTHVLNEDDLLASFSVAPRSMQRAASRTKAFGSKGATYAALVKASDLDPAQKTFWLALE